MKKYLIFTLLLAGSVAADLYSKTLAERNLASRTEDYQNYIHLVVPDPPPQETLGDFLTDQLSWNSEEEAREIAERWSLIVNEDYEPLMPGRADLPLAGGEVVEIQHRSIVLVEGFLSLRYVENRGAAWGFLNESEGSFRQPFFIIVGIIAIGVIFFLFRSVAPDRLFLVSALSFIVGGAAGNIVDRLRYGYVVDFIHWRPGFDWPTFNIADALIVVGVIMMLIEFIRDHVRQRRAENEEEEGAPA